MYTREITKRIVARAYTVALPFDGGRLVIPPKQYARMTEKMEEWVGELSNRDKEADLVEFQDAIGWPWKATRSQIKDWNERFVTWSTYFNRWPVVSPARRLEYES